MNEGVRLENRDLERSVNKPSGRGMRRMVAALGAAVGVLACTGALLGQGVTTSAVTGTVTGETGQPLPGMQVIVRQTQTGAQAGSLTGSNGNYYVQGLQPGGPYTIRVEGLGYAPATRTGVSLVLSQTARFDFKLSAQAVEIGAIQVTAERNGVFATTHTGPTTTISDSVLQRMPTLTRNFTDLVRISPFVTTGQGPSVGGENNRFNNIQIDGAVNNDLFGLGSSGTPGGQVSAKPISMEAISQFQILAAPFDVRQGGFTGGLVNAVTRSGTNQVHGSLFFYGRNQNFMGDQAVFGSSGAVTRRAASAFTSRQYGFSLGGPIIKDRLHFFVNGEWEQFSRPSTEPAVGRDAFASVGVSADSAARFQQVLQSTYSVGAGDVGFVQRKNPKGNLFARMDWQLSGSNRLTLRDSYSNAQDETLGTRSSSFYALTGGDYTIKNYSNSAVLQLESSLHGTLFNELLLNYELIRDRRNPTSNFPEIDVRVTSVGDTSSNGSGKLASATRTLVAGGEFFSHANQLDQDVLEVTDNLAWVKGIHKFTIGTHNEFLKFRNLFSPGVWGRWTFNSLADLAANKPSAYTVNIPVGNQTLDDITARFSVYQLGGYVQDQLTPSQHVNLSLGLRVDVPIFPTKPRDNPLFRQDFGVSTQTLPTGNPLFSPRFGFNWDVSGDASTQLRGGVGLFTGRPPYVWLSNSYGNTGRETVSLTCSGAAGTPTAPPALVINQGALGPGQCAGGQTASVPAAVVNVFDQDFKFPQDLKVSAGIDKRLPWGLTGTLEGLYTKSIHQIFVQEINTLTDTPIGTDAHGRLLYGTHNPATGAATPNRKTGDFLQVIRLTNASDNYSYNITGSLHRRFSNLMELQAGYTYAHAYDTQSLTSSIATSNYGFNPISGNPNAPPLAPSNWDLPHKITLSGTITPLRNARFGTTDISVIYTGQSGYDYSWTVNGDANGDGYQAPNISGRNNDLVYVPAAQTDILLKASSSQTVDQQWQALNSFIQGESCLAQNRGHLLPRNTCREPWHNRLDASLSQSIPTIGGQNFQVRLDVFNLPNMLNKDWGIYEVANNSTINLLNLVGWDNATNQGVYQFPGNIAKHNLLNPQSQWQIQLGGRYTF